MSARMCGPSPTASSRSGSSASATTGPSTRSTRVRNGPRVLSSRTIPPSSCASAWATSTPSARTAAATSTLRITAGAPDAWTRSSCRPPSSWVPSPTLAADKLRVVTSITDLKALTEAVGGDLVEVDSLARSTQNAHDLEARPSLMIKVRRADAIVLNGLDLDDWADVVAQGANNPNVIVGAPGRIDASRGLLVLEVPRSRIDRSMGDVHPAGNPHYTLDPGLAAQVTQNILEGLARLAPQNRATFERNRQQFLARLEEAMGRWNKLLEPYKGAPVVVNHNMWLYFLTRFGLVQAGSIEERPGIPPTPSHLVKLVNQMKQERIKVIVVEPWGDLKTVQRVAQEAGAQAAVLASSVGALKGTDSYINWVDSNVKMLAQALK
ncbi:MAG: zinc ABC transporter substrate-binding protein [Candidatus Rokuibacteriota bacterium]|nr:MAG: zinc ABC transporter substrate-binding protein [Candidatus Rokubacteria bacterium]